MYYSIKHLHSVLAIILLIGLLVAAIYALNGWSKNNRFTAGSKKVVLLGLIVTHIQFLVGLIMYFVSPLGASNFSKEAMGNSVSRLYMLEHPLTMLIAVILVTIGYSKAKRLQDDKRKFKTVAIFYLIGLLLMLSRIPWKAWLGTAQ